MTEIWQMRKLLEQNSGACNNATFFKTGIGEYAENDIFIGVRVPVLRKIAKEFKDVHIDILKKLIESPINEERLLAIFIMIYQYRHSSDIIYQFYLDHMNCINNWNLVDSSAHLIMGAYLLERDRDILLSLANSDNLWHRRVAIVATLYFIKKDEFEWTLKIAEVLLRDKEDLIHKATGWMLREVGKRDEECLLRFLQQFSGIMPRTMFRYATEITKYKEK